ncbi:Poly(ADP-ribose) glycohydrolase isoform [Thecamonas trahens ATCC 50062]|uniref:Poly(ADP-ribose) glycohydrolase isoform n=1 Tax=Thecamonas trahens ATCC 50062 TaxID=461836 RepID=A0A0L0DAW8_THETB|nr:Poly(ADP-ribose) glycohydrolase isoform [Thecamonas trahens ATCC 50062]KNC48443.1 Poly(ADP-ribose) glycohydrolase isoform [Thecamonas trahens ATCC 50062]|eukprot:XP_013758556.1 Poly(ADP-ribose) glycohydrolase isoform [Thecamonas trahens ATCC 50062]
MPHLQSGRAAAPWEAFCATFPASGDGLPRDGDGLADALAVIVAAHGDGAELVHSGRDRTPAPCNYALLRRLSWDAVDASFFSATLPALVAAVHALSQHYPDADAAPAQVDAAGDSTAATYTNVLALVGAAFFSLFPAETGFSLAPIFSMRANKAKAYAVVEYFARSLHDPPRHGSLSVSRIAMPDAEIPDWANAQDIHMATASVAIFDSGNIEDNGGAAGMVLADFANRFLGGAVLTHGAVQEEIYFGVVYPQLLVARLLAPRPMTAEEVIVMEGAERFCNYSGYAQTLKFAGSHVDGSPRHPESGSFLTRIVAFDALPFYCREDAKAQWSRACIDRELRKALTAFARHRSDPEELPPVATGNWGCGAFGGCKQLKALLQWMAAAAAGRPLAYFTFGDVELAEAFEATVATVVANSATVADLYSWTCSYGASIGTLSSGRDLLNYVAQRAMASA